MVFFYKAFRWLGFQNIGYAPDNILDWNPNNAIGTYPNEFSDSSNVSTIIAQMLAI